MLHTCKQILEWSLLRRHGWGLVSELVDIRGIKDLSKCLESGWLLLLLLLLLLHNKLLLLLIWLSSNGEGLKVSWLLGPYQVALYSEGDRLRYLLVRIYDLSCLQRQLMGDLCRILLVKYILLSSLLLRRLIYLLIYLLSCHLFRWLLHNHTTKIHVLVIQHLEFNVKWRDISGSVVITEVWLVLSDLSGILRTAINLCLNSLDSKLPFKRILQFDPFAHGTRRNRDIALLFS